MYEEEEVVIERVPTELYTEDLRHWVTGGQAPQDLKQVSIEDIRFDPVLGQFRSTS